MYISEMNIIYNLQYLITTSMIDAETLLTYIQ